MGVSDAMQALSAYQPLSMGRLNGNHGGGSVAGAYHDRRGVAAVEGVKYLV